MKKLFETAQDFFRLIHSFEKNENIANLVNVWMLEGPIQKPTIVTRWSFSLYFNEKLFSRQEQ